jgi:hypothetical protein
MVGPSCESMAGMNDEPELKDPPWRVLIALIIIVGVVIAWLYSHPTIWSWIEGQIPRR